MVKEKRGCDELSLLFEQYRTDKSEELRNEIVNRTLYIAEIMAKKIAGRGVEFDDLLQVASMALIGAVERFDPTKGLKFSTFATPCILGELKNYFRDKSRLIRVGRKSSTILQTVKRSISSLTGQLHRAPTAEEISLDTGLTLEEVIEAMEYNVNMVSLDAKLDDSETPLYEVIPDTKNDFEVFEDRETLRLAIKTLSKEEQQLLRQRFFENKSQSEIAAKLHVSQMYVSRMERKILQKLKNVFEMP